jgi:hypothetical protein
MSVITHTLSRWYKVALRLLDHEREVRDRVFEGVNGQHKAIAVLVLRVAEINDAGARAVAVEMPYLERLVRAHGVIRLALARANLEVGVTALLNEQEGLRRLEEYLTKVTEDIDHSACLTTSEAERIHVEYSAQGREPLGYSSTERVIPPRALIQDVRNRTREVRRRRAELADELGALNQRTVTITLDDDLAEAVSAR